MQLPVTDVEQLKKKVRKLTATRVLTGDTASVFLEMGSLRGCRVLVAAGYGPQGEVAEAVPHDRLLWILDGHVDIYDADDEPTTISQGESTVLQAGKPFRMVFPTLSIYLLAEPGETRA